MAVQKHADGYDEVIGGKWYLDKLKIYLASKYGEEKINNTFYKIQEIAMKILEDLQKAMQYLKIDLEGCQQDIEDREQPDEGIQQAVQQYREHKLEIEDAT